MTNKYPNVIYLRENGCDGIAEKWSFEEMEKRENMKYYSEKSVKWMLDALYGVVTEQTIPHTVMNNMLFLGEIQS